MSSESSYEEDSDMESTQSANIQEDFKSMSFEEIMKLKDKLGDKMYKEAVLGVTTDKRKSKVKKLDAKLIAKRANKSEPLEMSSKRQVPFLGVEQRVQRNDKKVRDPRFDDRAGTYNVDTFKKNYKFVSKIRQKEVVELKKQLNKGCTDEERANIKTTMQRLINKNVEQRNWQVKQTIKKKELQEIQKAHNEGRQPHYITKKERRVKELVQQFEQLKKTGKLNKHLEKRRKKNAAKDRKKIAMN